MDKVAETITARAYLGAPLVRPDIPLVLLSPRFGAPHLFYSDYAEELASHDWNIVTIDHSWDAPLSSTPTDN